MFDSAGQQPKQRGEIAPCKPEIYRSSNLSKFSTLKQTLKALDELVKKQLSDRVPEKLGHLVFLTEMIPTISN
jgi:hypothetical protein